MLNYIGLAKDETGQHFQIWFNTSTGEYTLKKVDDIKGKLTKQFFFGFP